MNEVKKVEVMYFTDILCVWAYVAQIRINELKAKFGDSIDLQYHFIPVFGSVASRLELDWNQRGGVSAYSHHVREIIAKFDYLEVHPRIWDINIPCTSISCHLFLKAIQLLEADNQLALKTKSHVSNENIFESIVWALRLAFFKEGLDVSQSHVQMAIAIKFGLTAQSIQAQINSGAAFAALDNDMQLKEKYKVSGSPTFILNEGRQIIYGNVGYRVIEANIQELLRQPKSQASWC
jgi:predicted DsbA family dithiol-disulfide isomerase